MASKSTRPGPVTSLLLKIRSIFGRNIVTFVFGLLFLYIVSSVIFYFTSTHIETYQVTQGPLSRNETYTGLALHTEALVSAESSGYISYYAREGDKINANGAVYSLTMAKQLDSQPVLSHEDLIEIRQNMLNFSKSFDPSNFNKTYNFKYQLKGSILQYAGVTGNTSTPVALTMEDLQGGSPALGVSESITYGDQTISKAGTDGIILYMKDNYCGKTLEDLTAEDFNQNSYRETDLKTDKMVSVGDDIYTIISDERWSLIIPLTEKQAAKLSNRSAIRVKFLKDDMTQSGSISIIEIDGGKYGKIDFNKGLVRYSTDRFLDIELVTNTVTGLKIPLSSIVTKDFYTISSDYELVTDDSSSVSFLVSERNSEGETVTRVVKPTIYASFENEVNVIPGEDQSVSASYTYYVDTSAFKKGDVIIKEQSPQEKFIVGDMAALEGVFSINQGFAVFRRIEILDQNEEYAIVARNTPYGLIRYDHIVKNADKVKEEDIL